MDRRGKGERPSTGEAEYLDREPALEAERVIARSRVGFLMEAKQRWHRRLSKPVLWDFERSREGQAFLIVRQRVRAIR